MPKKCETCRYYFQPFVEKGFDDAVCASPNVQRIDDPLSEKMFAPMLDLAREICDREGNGHFVYFEPKNPSAGAFVQITREPVSEPGAVATGLSAAV